jgi:uncharacterized protein YqjF (DUF2071 family)
MDTTAGEPDTIDRVSATLRPPGFPVMKQTWSELLFLHWRVREADLRPLVPTGLDIDTFEGRAWVGVVPFTVTGARVRFVPPLPFVSSFHEVNVRTYVHHHGRDPGVWFFSLDASKALVAEAARRLYHLPYRHADIDMTITEHAAPPPSPGRRLVEFVSRREDGNPPDLDVRYGAGDLPRPAATGTLEHFLIERYILYSVSPDGLHRARVHHAPYPVQPGVLDRLARESLVAAAGIQRPDADPLVHYASRVDVEIWPLEDVV